MDKFCFHILQLFSLIAMATGLNLEHIILFSENFSDGKKDLYGEGGEKIHSPC